MIGYYNIFCWPIIRPLHTHTHTHTLKISETVCSKTIASRLCRHQEAMQFASLTRGIFFVFCILKFIVLSVAPTYKGRDETHFDGFFYQLRPSTSRASRSARAPSPFGLRHNMRVHDEWTYYKYYKSSAATSISTAAPPYSPASRTTFIHRRRLGLQWLACAEHPCHGHHEIRARPAVRSRGMGPGMHSFCFLQRNKRSTLTLFLSILRCWETCPTKGTYSWLATRRQQVKQHRSDTHTSFLLLSYAYIHTKYVVRTFNTYR